MHLLHALIRHGLQLPQTMFAMDRVLPRVFCLAVLLAVAVGNLTRRNGDGGIPLVKRRVDNLERKLDDVHESVNALQKHVRRRYCTRISTLRSKLLGTCYAQILKRSMSMMCMNTIAWARF